MSSTKSPFHRLALESLARNPLLAAAAAIAETEPGSGDLAQLVLQTHPLPFYTGIYRERVEADAVDRLKSFGAKVKLAKGGAEGELPLENKSQDVLLSCYALENMRMSHLYMTCFEARRVLREGGHWLIIAQDPGRNTWENLVSFYRRKTGRPSLNVTHYISPEDWETEQDSFLPGLNRLFVLRRKSE